MFVVFIKILALVRQIHTYTDPSPAKNCNIFNSEDVARFNSNNIYCDMIKLTGVLPDADGHPIFKGLSRNKTAGKFILIKSHSECRIAEIISRFMSKV